MSYIELTPNTPGSAQPAALSPGGILLADFQFPVTQSEGTWHESAHTEGRHRQSTRPLNPTGSGRVALRGTSADDLRTEAQDFQRLVAETNKYGGLLTYRTTPAPAVRGVSAFAESATNPAVTLPTHQANDILLLYVETNTTTTVAAPSGWAAVTDAPQSSGALTQLHVFWRRATAANTANPTVTQGGVADHVAAYAIAISDCETSGNPWDVTAGGTEGADGTANLPTDTTTQADDLILFASSTDTDIGSGRGTAVSAPELINPELIANESTTQGGGGGLVIAAGLMDSVGSIGSPTITMASSPTKAMHTMALKATTDALESRVGYEIVDIKLSQDTNLDFRYASKYEAEMGFEFECKPYGRLAPVSVAFAGGALTGPVDYIDLPDVPGHVDALGTLELTDTSTQNRDHVEYGLEMDGYDSTAATSLVLYADSEMNATGLSGVANAGLTGDLAGTIWRATLFTSPLAVCSTGTQAHQGKRRVRARVAAQGDGPVYVRLAWRIGDGAWERNSWVEVGVGFWSEPSLGSIYVPLGESWEGRIEAKSANNATDTIDVDAVFPMPAERWGRSSRLVKSQTTAVLSAYDTFVQAGATDLTGKTLPLGGTWAEAGDAVGLVSDPTNDWVTRTEVSDGILHTNGHFALAGTTDYTATSVEIGVHTAHYHGIALGLVARYVDASNFLTAYLWADASNGGHLYVYKTVAGTSTLIGGPLAAYFPSTSWRKLRLEVDTLGSWGLYLTGVGRAYTEYWPLPYLSGQETVLATGGALASGQAGIFDWSSSASASTRYYDDFMLSAPSESLGAMFSGQSMRFNHDSCERENEAGTMWGAAPNFIGEHLLIPPAGRGDRTSRIAVLARRFDIDGGQPSSGTSDGMTATLTVTPRVLLVPE